MKKVTTKATARARKKVDVYDIINVRILEQLEGGIIPWEQSWIAVAPAYNRATGKAYSLLNQCMLGKGGEWATFKQWTSCGGKIRAGSHARKVAYWDFLVTDKQSGKSRHATAEDWKNNPQDIWGCLKYSNVFHVSDVEGVEPMHKESKRFLSATNTKCAYIDKYSIKCEVNIDSTDMYYSPIYDTICIPPLIVTGKKYGDYTKCVFHELIHSTGHPSRLNRLQSGEKVAFGSALNVEEAIAEMGSSYLTLVAGFDECTRSTADDALYRQNWYNAIKADKKLFCQAASQAEKAAKMVLDCYDGYNGGDDDNGDNRDNSDNGDNRDNFLNNGGITPPEKPEEREIKAEKAEDCKIEEKIAEKEGVEKAYEMGIISKFERDCRIDKLNLKGHKILLDRIMCKYHDTSIGGKQAALDRFVKISDEYAYKRHITDKNFFVVNNGITCISSACSVVLLGKNIFDLRGSVINFTDERPAKEVVNIMSYVEEKRDIDVLGNVTLQQIQAYHKNHKEEKHLLLSVGTNHAYTLTNGYVANVVYDYAMFKDLATILSNGQKEELSLYTVQASSPSMRLLVIQSVMGKAMLLGISIKPEYLEKYKDYTFAQD